MRWATFITKNSEITKHIKEKKELIVEENRRNQLDVKLKEMIEDFDQAEARRKDPITQSGTGNGIRRREGEKDKRFSVWNKRRVAWSCKNSLFRTRTLRDSALCVEDIASPRRSFHHSWRPNPRLFLSTYERFILKEPWWLLAESCTGNVVQDS